MSKLLPALDDKPLIMFGWVPEQHLATSTLKTVLLWYQIYVAQIEIRDLKAVPKHQSCREGLEDDCHKDVLGRRKGRLAT